MMLKAKQRVPARRKKCASKNTLSHNRASFEFSKRLVVWTNIAFWSQVFATIVLVYCGAKTGAVVSEPLVAILATTATLAGAVHLGYFGKAGAENYNKISIGSATDEDYTEMNDDGTEELG